MSFREWFAPKEQVLRDRLEAEIKKLMDAQECLESDLHELRQEKISLQSRNDASAHKLAEAERKLGDVKHEAEREKRELQHLIKLQEEKRDLEKEQYKVKCDAEKNSAIAKVKDQYRDKLEKFLESRGDELKGMFTEILNRLPDVNVMLGSKAKPKAQSGE